MTAFLAEDDYVDISAPGMVRQARALFDGVDGETEKVKIAYTFVRDEIAHSFDSGAAVITARASGVLRHRTGICHAKANLLAALLRSQGIPAGFCFQHLTLADGDALGYCVHAYNAVLIGGRWIRLDARGNKPGVNAQFSLGEPVLAYANRAEFDEYHWPGIYARPHGDTMNMLERAGSLREVLDNMPCGVTDAPDIPG